MWWVWLGFKSFQIHINICLWVLLVSLSIMKAVVELKFTIKKTLPCLHQRCYIHVRNIKCHLELRHGKILSVYWWVRLLLHIRIILLFAWQLINLLNGVNCQLAYNHYWCLVSKYPVFKNSANISIFCCTGILESLVLVHLWSVFDLDLQISNFVSSLWALVCDQSMND